MTRWARAGNAQKHKKLPGDATKWGEFDFQKCNNNSSEQKGQMKRNHDTNSKASVSSSDLSTRKHSGSKKRRKGDLLQDEKTIQSKSDNESNEKASASFNVNPKHANKEISNETNSSPGNTSKEVKNKKNTIKQNFEQAEISQTVDVKESKKKKKKTYLERLKKKRAENGILLLPPKIERKLYMIKKKLREKRLPPEVIKDILRKERRREELQFRKTFNPSKLCFNCRQPGHVLADCPTKLGSSNQETGMCFKCGSVEHTSFKCPEDVQGFPFAKCFICKEQGHISKDCPRNKHGVYPKGGRCNFCGNVNHLKKDCPSLSKRKNDESTVTLPTINEGTSIDAEEVPMSEISLKKERVKKPKIVKF